MTGQHAEKQDSTTAEEKRAQPVNSRSHRLSRLFGVEKGKNEEESERPPPSSRPSSHSAPAHCFVSDRSPPPSLVGAWSKDPRATGLLARSFNGNIIWFEHPPPIFLKNATSASAIPIRGSPDVSLPCFIRPPLITGNTGSPS
ncbi:hypothetical protein CRG98_015423 [Punica granatum]|uniref:Uncharacterized protein n=1 Tax=Punica granatum TaxID=22663 RepID=A0A2I0K935_PUNGR|nr:hypothetical protein CRG98_015423 [Punica granatum]